jgi:hypothetical protein
LEDLFQLEGIWYSWNHHSRFSDPKPELVLQRINASIQAAHEFLKHTNFLIITLGSAFSYRLTSPAQLASKKVNDPVSNCHRAPANWFSKEMMPVDQLVERLGNAIRELKKLNPTISIFFTISPVRHIRDGVQDNNRSKARLFETIQQLEEADSSLYYFPAYELVVDVLRDYRFYDIDLVHPNYAATEFVVNHFLSSCLTPGSQELAQQIRKIKIAYKHKPQHSTSHAHQQFLAQFLEKTLQLQQNFPFLNFEAELKHFENKY